MRAIIRFIDSDPLYLHGDYLGAYESGSYTNIKDYDKKENKILASIPTSRILFIEFEDAPKVTVTVREISKHDNL